jgi:hypothetical protein
MHKSFEKKIKRVLAAKFPQTFVRGVYFGGFTGDKITDFLVESVENGTFMLKMK